MAALKHSNRLLRI